MASIANYLKAIMSAVYGEEVRQAIHDSIKQCSDNGEEVKERFSSLENAVNQNSETMKKTYDSFVESVNSNMDEMKNEHSSFMETVKENYEELLQENEEENEITEMLIRKLAAADVAWESGTILSNTGEYTNETDTVYQEVSEFIFLYKGAVITHKGVNGEDVKVYLYDEDKAYVGVADFVDETYTLGSNQYVRIVATENGDFEIVDKGIVTEKLETVENEVAQLKTRADETDRLAEKAFLIKDASFIPTQIGNILTVDIATDDYIELVNGKTYTILVSEDYADSYQVLITFSQDVTGEGDIEETTYPVMDADGNEVKNISKGYYHMVFNDEAYNIWDGRFIIHQAATAKKAEKATADADGNIITDSYSQRKYWLASVTTNTWSRICKISGCSCVNLCLRFTQSGQESTYTYMITTGHGKVNAVQVGFNGYTSNANIAFRIVRDASDLETFYIEVLNPYGYNNATETAVHCTMTGLSKDALSDIAEFYTAYTAPEDEATVIITFTSKPNEMVAPSFKSLNEIIEQGVRLSNKYAAINHTHATSLFSGSASLVDGLAIPIIEKTFTTSDYDHVLVTVLLEENQLEGSHHTLTIDWEKLFDTNDETRVTISYYDDYFEADVNCDIRFWYDDGIIYAQMKMVAHSDSGIDISSLASNGVQLEKIVAYK